MKNTPSEPGLTHTGCPIKVFPFEKSPKSINLQISLQVDKRPITLPDIADILNLALVKCCLVLKHTAKSTDA